ncbi:hypothetical protein IWQ55_006618, partial [Labrenzia sp. EL_208]|nr:hypothetical protein [Labrenzia sp. EL_132]MBG6233376.1 hypothetical protein [Labrenzia sp. EL_208]
TEHSTEKRLTRRSAKSYNQTAKRPKSNRSLHRGLSTKSDADLVDQEYTRIVLESGYGIYPPTPRHHGLDLRDVTFPDGRNAFDVYQEYAAVPKGHGS